MNLSTEEVFTGVYCLGAATIVLIFHLVMLALGLWTVNQIDFYYIPNGNLIEFHPVFHPQMFWAGDGEHIYSIQGGLKKETRIFLYFLFYLDIHLDLILFEYAEWTSVGPYSKCNLTRIIFIDRA
jgi:hypothetical protein